MYNSLVPEVHTIELVDSVVCLELFMQHPQLSLKGSGAVNL